MSRTFVVTCIFVAAVLAPCTQAHAKQVSGSRAQSIETFDQAIDRMAIELSPKSGRIAVLDFLDLDGQATEYGKLFSQSLTTAIVSRRTPGLNVLERSQVEQLARETNFIRTTGESAYVKLGKALGADAVVFGTAHPFGASVIINARLVEVGTRSIVGASHATVNIPGPAQLPAESASGPIATSGGLLTASAEALHRTVESWDVSIAACRREGAFIRCTIGIANRGEDRKIWLSACDGDPGGNLPNCTRGYFPGSVVLPFAYERANATPLDGERPGVLPIFTVLAGRSVNIVVRLANPPPNVTRFRQLDVRFAGRPFETVSFTNVPIATSDVQNNAVASFGFEFSVPACRRVGATTDVTCRVSIVNHSSEQDVSFQEIGGQGVAVKGNTRALDIQGSSYFLRTFRFLTPSAQNQGSYTHITMPRADSVQLQFRVEKVPLNIDLLASVELIGQAYNRLEATFTSVPILR